MKSIRIGNDISVQWLITHNGLPESLEGRKLAVILSCPLCKREITDFKVVGNAIRFTFYGKDQRYCGVYTLTLVENRGERGMMAVDDYDDGIEEETPVTPSQDGGWEGLVASLDDAETAYLRDSLTPRGAGPWSLEGTGRRPSEVEDAVNSKAMDAIGDAIVEGGRAVEDYAPDIEGALR